MGNDLWLHFNAGKEETHLAVSDLEGVVVSGGIENG